MLQNAYLLAKIGADTAENEQHFAEICQKLATTLRVRRAVRGPRALERQLDVLARPHVRGPLRSGAKARWRTHQLAKRGKTFAAFG